MTNLQLACWGCNRDKGDEMPEKTKGKWDEPADVDDITMAFPANLDNLLPKMDEIPDEFKGNQFNPYVALQQKWFFQGISQEEIPIKASIDRKKALRHLSTCMRSFEPSHEHKEAGVAYLMSLWMVPLKDAGA